MVAMRVAKVLMVASVALFASLVAFGNVTDYATNFAFVQHVLAMDTIFPDSEITYRAITAPWLHHLAYGSIIATEAAVAVLCWIGTIQLARDVRSCPGAFHRAKAAAIAGLTLGFLLWFTGFMVIGGEWFAMWQSQQWNGVPSAFRFAVIIMAVLIFVAMPDEDLHRDESV